MKLEQTIWTKRDDWQVDREPALERVDLVLAFGDTALVADLDLVSSVRTRYPEALLLGCSTAGTIQDTRVFDGGVAVTAIRLERARVQGAQVVLDDEHDSYVAGRNLAQTLDHSGLRHVFVLSDGLHVNGSELVRGLDEHLPPSITVTGGLSGDAERFHETLVLWNGAARSRTIAAVGFYGDGLKVGYGSLGGWDPFGPERLITRSDRNVLYELDGQLALALYKRYLGEHAAGLPATGLYFPLSLRGDGAEPPVVRTVLAVDEASQTMTFAGDLPEGSYARLMKANFDRLLDGAVGAAQTSYTAIGSSTPELAILISCVGRRLVLKQRTEEEVECVREVLGAGAALTGFYSYGEISPFSPGARCDLHNQTMTITTLSER
ncbi:MAG: FIST C-terminal domain-containing protein [Chloroflexi bacterium]|nr:FIST C-terminal domain-containing protein [Chloroflexota bacterium]